MAAKRAKAVMGAKGYKRNFLSNVILRLDFDKISLNFLKDFSEELKSSFPLQEQTEAMAGSILVELNTGKVEQASQKNLIWIFRDSKKTKKLQIGTDHILIEYSSYKNSEELLKDVKNVFARFIELSKLESVLRLGLRYTNEIDLREIQKLDWNKYINLNLLGGIIHTKQTGMRLARAMSQIVIKEELADITFNYGIWNTDYPNENVRKEFLLDFDCFSRLPVSVEDNNIVELVKIFNLYIEKLFESSITAGFRKLLNNHD